VLTSTRLAPHVTWGKGSQV